MDITFLAQLANGLVRNISTSSNTLVVNNLKIRLGTSYHVTFAGTLTANRTITIPDANVDLGLLVGNVFIRADGTVPFTGHQSMGGFRLTNLGAPVNPNDAATKVYVDNAIEGVKPKEAVRVATTGNITLSGLQTIDGVSVVAGDRVLVKDQTNLAENGIYIAATGAWSRAPDFDQLTPTNEIKGAYVAVREGNTHAGKVFVCNADPSNIGTDPITFVFFNSITTLNAGDGISYVGTTISVRHDGEGLIFNASGELSLELQGTTLTKGPAGLRVSDGGIGTTQLANDAVTTVKIQDSAVTEPKIANNAITTNKIANSAVTKPKLANNAVDENIIDSIALDQETITGGSGTKLKAIRSYTITLPANLRVVGEDLSSGVYAVRFGINSLTETTGRLYRAHNDASASDRYLVCAIINIGASVEAGDILTGAQVVVLGEMNLPANTFTTADIGKTVYLGANGAITTTAPTASNTAVVELGYVIDTNKMFVKPAILRGVN